MRRAGFVLMAFLSLGVAGYAVVAYGFRPVGSLVHPEMRAVFEANRAGIYAHIFGSAVALALGPFQFMARLRARRPAWHRWMGRLYLGAGVLVGGLSGLYMSRVAFGGPVARSGFAVLAVAWIGTGLLAWAAIRRGDVASHRRWMTRSFALAFAAVTLRIYLPGSLAAGVAFETAYPVIAWACWVPNLLVAEALLAGKGAVPAGRFDRARVQSGATAPPAEE